MNPTRHSLAASSRPAALRRVCVTALLVAAGCGAALLPRPALAAESTPPAVKPTTPPATEEKPEAKEEVLQLATYKVTASYRASLESALDAKRRSEAIIDGIEAEGIGSFPDLNLGEALQRVTGVQINRSNSNPNNSPRDASINVRGLPNDFSRTMINGLPFADPVDDGGTSFGVLQSDLFAGLEVVKAPTANMTEGGLSGIINLKTGKPLRMRDGATLLSVKSTYEELTEEFSPEIAFSTSKHLLDGKLGVAFAGIYSNENYRRDTTLVTRYSQLSQNGAPVLMPDGGKVYYPGQLRQIVSGWDGNVTGVNTSAQYKFTDELESTVSVLYSKRSLDRPLDIWVVSDQGATTQVTAKSTPVFAGNNAAGQPEYVVTDVSMKNIDTTQGPRPGNMDDKILNVNWETEWNSGPWLAKSAVAYSEGTNRTNTIQYDYRFGGANGLIANASSGGANWNGFSLSVTDAANHAFAAVNTLQNTTGNYVPSLPHLLEAPSAIGGYNRLVIADTQSDIETDMGVLDLVAERKISLPILKSIEFGARYTTGAEHSDVQRHTVYGINPAKLTTATINNDLVSDVYFLGQNSFMGGNVSSLNNWLSLNGSLIEQRLQPVTVPANYTLTNAGWVNNPFDGGVFNGTYKAATEVFSAFSQAKLQTKIGGKQVRGNVGLRYVDTSIDLASNRNNRGGIERVRTSNNYDHLLPSANFAADLTDTLVLRGAYAETFVRPLNRDNTPAQSITVSLDQTDPNPIKAQLGNTGLRPYTADSFDVSLEWYNRPGGSVTVAWFQKSIDGFISTVNLCPGDGANLGFGALTGTGVRNSSGVFDCRTSGGQGIIVSQQQNSADTVDVQGFEFSVQQNLDFLPGFWKNFGTVFNYSTIDVSGSINGAPVQLGGVSQNNYNAIAFYEGDRFAVRFAYNWRDEYQLGEGGTFSGAPRSVKARGQLDASLSWKLNDKLSLSLEAFNLTGTPLEEFEGNGFRPRRTDYDGSTYIMGARYAF